MDSAVEIIFFFCKMLKTFSRWVHPDGGRKTYETKSPGSGEVLAATTQVVDLIYVNIQISNT